MTIDKASAHYNIPLDILREYESLKPSCPGATLMPGKLLNGRLSETELKKWAESMALL